MVKRFILVLVAFVLHITTNASAIDDIIAYCRMYKTVHGISIDYCQVDKNKLTFVCHINKASSSYSAYLKMIGSVDSDAIKQNIKESYEVYGGTINAQDINLYGTPYDDTWILYTLFESKMVADIGQYINCYKMGNELRQNNVELRFIIKGTGMLHDMPNKIIHSVSFNMNDFDEVATIAKYCGNAENVMREKYTMLRGVRLNQKALPIQAGLGVTLDTIKIQNNTITYHSVVTDLVADATSLEDMKGTIRQMQLNMDAIIDKEKLSKAKGFPLLNIKMVYEWYRKSNKEKIASVTFAYPSLEILNAWPDSIKLEESKIDYTFEDGETKGIPICLNDPVDLGVSVKWSSMNLGANKVEEYGGLFGFGDVTGKLKSMKNQDYQIPDTLKSIKGNLVYDIVRRKKGEWWHMPSTEEWRELLKSAIFVQTTYKEVPGYKVIGTNGRAIFLPKSGFRDGKKYFNRNNSADYWSSDVSKEPNGSEYLHIDSEVFFTCPRWRGMSVRPVREY